MLKVESCSVKDGRCDANNNWARICDACRSAACTVYCRADLAYLCGGCDTRIHSANQVASRHERVRVCEACECAPAAFLCKADAASLCAACDSDIHSANPLARRHHRVPILPVPEMIDGLPYVGLIMGSTTGGTEELLTLITDETENEDDEDESASWLLLNPVKNYDDVDNGQLFIEDMDDYLCLDDDKSYQNYQFNDQQHYIVPDEKSKDQVFHSCFQLGMEYSCPASVSHHSISLSPVDVGIFPESRITEVSITHSRSPKGTIDLFSSPPIQMPIQLTLMDREARVLRYREKKKSRKFEKTIRYASRKAYAETRPRVKGRFAKRKDITEIEMDQIFSASLLVETQYGIVPSF